MMAHKTPPTFRMRTLSAALAGCFASTVVIALPTGGSVANGTATITQSGNVLTITNSNGAIINWQGFSIGKGETTRFIQPNSVSSVLNRVVTNDPSVLLGKLLSNGQVFLVNPAGILVGKDARIDVGAFVASTLQISDADFLARRFNFIETPGAGKLINKGVITTPSGGSVYLVAPDVENAGLIRSPEGEVILAAGQSVQIGDTATPGVRAEVTGSGKATNVGRIVASAGDIGLVGALVKNSGSLSATSAVSEGGRIYLKATEKVEQTKTGKINVSGAEGGSVLVQSDDLTLLEGSVLAVGHRDEGGDIQALGDRVGIVGTARLDASGRTAGGSILVGGDYQGKNSTVQNAEFTYVGGATLLKADATGAGDGGKVIVWADDSTRAYGKIYARAAGSNGDGGFVETSGKRFLDVVGARVRTDGGAKGAAGNWLLDPDNLKIIHATSSSSDSGLAGTSPNFSADTMAGGTYSYVSDYTINQAIGSNSTVSIYAQNDVIFDGNYSGAVTISKQASDTFSTSLSVTAGTGDILFKGNTLFQTLGSTGTGGLTVILSPGSGTSTVDAGAALTFKGGVTPVVLDPGGYKTLINKGTFTLEGNTQVDLGSSGAYATFINDTSGNVLVKTSAAQGWPFKSDTMDGGVIENHGNWTADLTNGSQSYEAIFINDDTGATLNVINGGGSRYLSLQNADELSSEINIASGSTLWLSEMHSNTSSGGTHVSLEDAVITGPGILKVGGGAQSVTAKISGTTFNGGVKLWEGSTGILDFDGTQSHLNGSSIYSSNSFTAPDSSMLALTGDVGFYSAGSLSFANQSTNGKLYLVAGWNGSSLTAMPGVSSAGSIILTGTVSAGGALWARAAEDIIVDASDDDAILTSGGAGQTINATGDFKVRGGAGKALVQYTGSGTQKITADKVRVEGGSSTGEYNSWAKIRSTGKQDITAATSIVLQGGGGSSAYGDYASIEANGDQLITAPAIAIYGGSGGSSGANNYAGIFQLAASGTQKIVLTGSSGLELIGGDGYGTAAWSSSDCSGCTASNNGARIYSKGTSQEIDFRAAGATLTLTGGSDGSRNDASISSEGSGTQKIWSSTGTRPTLVLNGGTSGGVYNSAQGRNLGNEAAIMSDAKQIIRASAVTMEGGAVTPPASTSFLSGAFLIGAEQDIDVSGNLSMIAGNSTVVGEYAIGGAPVVIGNDDGAKIKLVVGGDLSVTGSSGNSALIGAAVGNATVNITADNISYSGDDAYLGNLSSAAKGGSVNLTASGSIEAPALVRTASLTATAAGDIALTGTNDILRADLYSSVNGDITLNTSNATTYLDRAVAKAGSVAATNSTGNLSVKTVTASSSVELTAKKAILDGNGSAINITAPGVVLTSQQGGTSTGLAISADVSAQSLSATVGSDGSAAYGGVRVVSHGNGPSSLSISDMAASGGDIFFRQKGNLTTNANYSVSSASGSILLGTEDGALNLAAGIFSAPLGMDFVAGTNMTLGSFSFSRKAAFAAGGDITVTASLSGPKLGFVAGGDLLLSSGAHVEASETLGFKATNVSLDGATLKTATGNLTGTVGGVMKLNNGSLLSAGDDVKLTFTAADAKLILNEVASMSPSYIKADTYTNIPATIYLNFVGLAAGGITIDGVDMATSTSSSGSGSGFYAAGAPAIAGSGLVVTYGSGAGGGEFIKDILNSKPPSVDTTLTPGSTTGSGDLAQNSGNTNGDNEFGGGSATGENNEGRNRNRNRGGMCRG